MFKRLVLTFLAVFLLTGCGSHLEKKTGFYLDTVFEVSLKYRGGKERQESVDRALQRAFIRIIELDTNINVISPISEISAVNSRAGLKMVEISAVTYELFKKSIMASALTDGYFDVTWPSLSRLFEGSGVSQGQINRARNAASYLNIYLDKGLTRVRFNDNATVVNFAYIKHGYALDILIEELRKTGLKYNGYLKAGAVKYYYGNKKETFKFPNGASVRAKVGGKAVATISVDDPYYANSGFWKQYLTVPATDEDITAVIVVAPNAAMAEVLANAFFFMGTEKSLAKIKELKGKVSKRDLYDVIFALKDGDKIKVVSTLRVRGQKK